MLITSLTFISGPTLFVMMYPLTLSMIEGVMILSCDYSSFTFKNWVQDFQRDFDRAKLDNHNDDQTNLKKSELSID